MQQIKTMSWLNQLNENQLKPVWGSLSALYVYFWVDIRMLLDNNKNLLYIWGPSMQKDMSLGSKSLDLAAFHKSDPTAWTYLIWDLYKREPLNYTLSSWSITIILFRLKRNWIALFNSGQFTVNSGQWTV